MLEHNQREALFYALAHKDFERTAGALGCLEPSPEDLAHARRSWRLAKAREGVREPYVWSEHAARSPAPHSAYDPG